jgi:ABC-type polysaccharide/polyol phosphate export permease
LLVWLFFSQALLGAATSLVDQAGLISQVRFPRQSIPAAAVAVQLVPMLAMLVVLLPVAVAVLGNGSLSLLLLVPLIVCLFAFTLGLALIAAALHAHFRDVQPILNATLLPLFFISGVLFSLQRLPGLAHSSHWVESALRWGNPVAPFVEAFRTVLYSGRAPSAATLGYVVVAALISVTAGWLVFRRLQAELAVVL